MHSTTIKIKSYLIRFRNTSGTIFNKDPDNSKNSKN